MKHINIFAWGLIGLAIPAITFAQANEPTGVLQTLGGIEDSSKILEMVSLWATIIIALATNAMVWMGGRQMHGGVFGRVLTLFSLGMTFIFLGFATQIPWFKNIDPLYLKMAHDSLYIIGYIMMGLAASRLLKVIKGE